jgi:hypothetical protein
LLWYNPDGYLPKYSLKRRRYASYFLGRALGGNHNRNLRHIFGPKRA